MKSRADAGNYINILYRTNTSVGIGTVAGDPNQKITRGRRALQKGQKGVC